jgi:hypothetical protein
MIRDSKNRDYDVRLQSFLKQIMEIARMTPQDRYLHPLMNSVPFQDLETAMMIIDIDHKKAAGKRTARR